MSLKPLIYKGFTAVLKIDYQNYLFLMGQQEMENLQGGRGGRVTPTQELGTLWEHKCALTRSLAHVNQGLQPSFRHYVEFESLRFRHIQSPDYSGLFAFLGMQKLSSSAPSWPLTGLL